MIKQKGFYLVLIVSKSYVELYFLYNKYVILMCFKGLNICRCEVKDYLYLFY